MAASFIPISVSIAVVIVGILFATSQLDYPAYVYIPGLIARISMPLAPYKDVEWRLVNSFSTESTKPNIIYIIADDLGYNDLSFGSAGVGTPHIDSIASNGVSFLNAYAGHATCSPSRASILTGRYATRFGFEYTAIHPLLAWMWTRPIDGSTQQPLFFTDKYKSIPPMSDMVVPTTEIMISNVVGAQNYSTIYLGKWHLGEAKGTTPFERGFQETLAFLKGAMLYLDRSHLSVVNAPIRSAVDDFLFANLRSVISLNNGQIFEPNEYMTDYLGKEAAKAIKAKGKSPYFMILAYNAPHNPFQAKREDYDSPEIANITDHTRRVYAAMIKSLDRSVGTVLKAVEESGRADDTIIIFTSDNGGPPTVNMPELNRPFRGWKTTFFEGGIRVPFFMSWPKVIPRGVVYDKPVGHVDMFATAAEAAGVSMSTLAKETNRVFDGINLVSHVSEFKPPADGNADRIIGASKPLQTHSKQEDAASLPHASLYWRSSHYVAVRNGNLKIQVTVRPDKVWLFDLAHDPTEQSNLAINIRWSELKMSATEALQRCVGGDSQGCAGLLAAPMLCEDEDNMAFFLTSSTHDSASLAAARLLCMGVQVLYQGGQQSEPLWASIAEIPVPVDHIGDSITAGAEYVYWAN